MNFHPQPGEFRTAPPSEPDLTEVEQTLIAACLFKPERIVEVMTKIEPGDIQNSFHRSVLGALYELFEAGRNPSVEALAARFGDDEIEAGLRPREYLMRLFQGALTAAFMPLQDAIEVVRDASMRRRLSDVGSALIGQSANPAERLADVAARAVANIDDVLTTLRSDHRRAYDAAEAARIAMAHFASSERVYPTTGLIDLDKLIGGWPRGQMTVLAGRPGMGKSAIATSAVLKAAAAGHACLFFSLEMVGEQLGARLLTDLAWTQARPVHYEALLHRRTDEVGPHERRRLDEAHAKLGSLPVMIEEQRGLTLAEISARARKVANAMDRAGRRLDLVVVDHMLLVRPASRYSGNRVQEVREISDGLATLAKELDVSMLALCQLNRAVEGRENKRPSLADLRDSGSIEEDASAVCFLYRPAYYLEQQRFDEATAEQKRKDALAEVHNLLEIVVSKNRNGRCGVVDAFIDVGANAVRNSTLAR